MVWSMMPPADAGYRGGTGGKVRNLYFVARTISLPAHAFLPFPYLAPDGSTRWNSWAFGSTKTHLIVADLVAIALVLAGALVVARRRSALVLWAMAVGGFYVFFFLLHPGYGRHHGYIGVAFIAAAWLAYARPSSRWTPSLARVLHRLEPARAPVLTFLLLPMIGAAWQLARADRDQLFASGPQVVAELRRQHLIDLPIVGDAYPWSSPVAALLDRPIFLPRENRATTWVSNRYIQNGPSADVILDRTMRAFFRTHCQVVVLANSDRQFSPWLMPQLARVSPPAPERRPMSGVTLNVWLATAPRCAGSAKR